MVELVRHTLVDGSIGLNINIITEFEGGQVGGQMYWPMFPEGLGEHLASTSSETE